MSLGTGATDQPAAPVEPPPVAVGAVRMYHGTTAGAARRILDDGFDIFDLTAELAGVAADYGVDQDDLFELVRRDWPVIGHLRGSSVSLAGHLINAARYAGRSGGEGRFQLLVAVRRIREPSVAQRHAEAWAARECAGEPVAIVVDVPLEVVCAHRSPPRFSSWEQMTTEGILDVIEGDKDLQVSLPLPVGWVVGVIPVEPVVTVWALEESLGRRFASVKRPPSDGPWIEEIWWRSTIDRWLESLA